MKEKGKNGISRSLLAGAFLIITALLLEVVFRQRFDIGVVIQWLIAGVVFGFWMHYDFGFRKRRNK